MFKMKNSEECMFAEGRILCTPALHATIIEDFEKEDFGSEYVNNTEDENLQTSMGHINLSSYKPKFTPPVKEGVLFLILGCLPSINRCLPKDLLKNLRRTKWHSPSQTGELERSAREFVGGTITTNNYAYESVWTVQFIKSTK